MKRALIIGKASDLANRAHMGQARKVTRIPYIVHPYRVACLVEQFRGTEEQIAAAWCHDVLEDCPAFREEAEVILSPGALALVRELTKDIDPATGKGVKGELFLAELRHMSAPAAFIKLADRIDNLRDGIASMPTAWLAAYLDESKDLHGALHGKPGCGAIAGVLAACLSEARARVES